MIRAHILMILAVMFLSACASNEHKTLSKYQEDQQKEAHYTRMVDGHGSRIR